jgi:PAS domain S-box-containing protein
MGHGATARDSRRRILLAGRGEWFGDARASFADGTAFVTATTVETACDELEAAGPEIDCIVVGAALEGASGSEAVSAIREANGRVPVVVAPQEGSERLASDTVAAGADEYVPSGDVRDCLAERVEHALETATEQRRLEAELRESERLHRITLNNMTDTVLVTDEAGRFTYVCPNVHFIFGYTAEEIHELGSIAELMGEDVFAEERLAEEGVLTNIECTVTDSDGEEHTLLVNVKEVSIQGGTRLYSCRDITKRKERERALTTLHDTSRQLLAAESRTEAVELLVGDVTEGLPVDGAACYLFDGDDNLLQPAAVTEPFSELHGQLPSLPPDTNTLVGTAFVRSEVAYFDDVRRADRLSNPTTDLRAAAYLPVGDNGVLVVGCETPSGVDDVTIELADLFAATAEAALDRIDRESELREQEEALQRRNERLVEINRTNDIIREIDRALVGAETREEIETAVCNRLTAAGRFELAWVGERTATGLEVRAWSGTGRSYLDALPETVDETTEPSAETIRRGEPTTVSNVASDPRGDDWRVEALSLGLQSVISVPLKYEGATYGALTVYASGANAIDDPIDSVLVELGETIASAIGSARQRDALLGGTVTELTYGVTDEECLLYGLATRTDTELAVDGGAERLDDRVLLFVTVERGTVEEVARAARAFVSVDEARVIADEKDGGTLRLKLSEPFIGTTLADHGAVLRRLRADGDGATLVVTVPGSTDVRRIDEVIEGWYERPELRARRERDRRHASGPKLRSRLADRLTDRQLEAARTAYHSGYFEAPREATGEDIAEALEVSSSAFYQLNRKAQRNLLSFLFDGNGFDNEG